MRHVWMIGVRFQMTRKRLFSLIPSFVSLFDPAGGDCRCV